MLFQRGADFSGNPSLIIVLEGHILIFNERGTHVDLPS